MFTGGFSEFARKKPFQPGGGTSLKGAAIGTVLGPYGSAVTSASGTKIDTPSQTDTPVNVNRALKPRNTDVEHLREARNVASRRRKEFQNVGRSSTLLTGSGGLTGSGPGEQKTLLGY